MAGVEALASPQRTNAPADPALTLCARIHPVAKATRNPRPLDAESKSAGLGLALGCRLPATQSLGARLPPRPQPPGICEQNCGPQVAPLPAAELPSRQAPAISMIAIVLGSGTAAPATRGPCSKPPSENAVTKSLESKSLSPFQSPAHPARVAVDAIFVLASREYKYEVAELNSPSTFESPIQVPSTSWT